MSLNHYKSARQNSFSNFERKVLLFDKNRSIKKSLLKLAILKLNYRTYSKPLVGFFHYITQCCPAFYQSGNYWRQKLIGLKMHFLVLWLKQLLEKCLVGTILGSIYFTLIDVNSAKYSSKRYFFYLSTFRENFFPIFRH